MSATSLPGSISDHQRGSVGSLDLFGSMPSSDSIFDSIRATANHYGDFFAGAVGQGLTKVASVFGLGTENPGTAGDTRNGSGQATPIKSTGNADEKVAKGDDATPTSALLSSQNVLLVAGGVAAFFVARKVL